MATDGGGLRERAVIPRASNSGPQKEVSIGNTPVHPADRALVCGGSRRRTLRCPALLKPCRNRGRQHGPTWCRHSRRHGGCGPCDARAAHDVLRLHAVELVQRSAVRTGAKPDGNVAYANHGWRRRVADGVTDKVSSLSCEREGAESFGTRPFSFPHSKHSEKSAMAEFKGK